MKPRNPENTSSSEEEGKKENPDQSQESQDTKKIKPKTTQLPDYNQLLIDAAKLQKVQEGEEDNEEKEEEGPEMKEKRDPRYTMVPTTEYLAEITRETVLAERRLRELRARKKELEKTKKKRVIIPLDELKNIDISARDEEQEEDQEENATDDTDKIE